MRKLTFRGFLKQYTHDLSLHGSYGIGVLAREADHENIRLQEPLLFYAFETSQTELLLRNCGEALREEYRAVLPFLQRGDFAHLPEGYQKVLDAYSVKANRVRTDQRAVAGARGMILQLQTEKNISTYRICTDLKLNQGNVGGWLKHGSAGKVSYRNALRIVSYMKAQ